MGEGTWGVLHSWALMRVLRPSAFDSEGCGSPTPNVRAVRDGTRLALTHFTIFRGVVFLVFSAPAARPR